MSKPNEERDIYYIPPNFLASGRLFGGMIRARNAIEACVLVLLTGAPIIKLPFSLTTRIIILCLVSLPLGIFGVIGFEGDSLSEFAVNWVRWLIHRRTLRAIVRKTIPASLSTLYARMAPRSCWLVWSMIRTKICSRQSSMAIAHRTSQQRLLNTTTLILKNEEDRLCLIGRLELLR